MKEILLFAFLFFTVFILLGALTFFVSVFTTMLKVGAVAFVVAYVLQVYYRLKR